MRRAIPLLVMLIPSLTWAHQPVMDMAPRWSGGSGLQVRFDRTNLDRLLVHGNRAEGPDGLGTSVSTTWIEGVYTFRRSVRVTFKQPIHSVTRREMRDGRLETLGASGLGDLEITAPIKKYANYPTRTWNLGFNPSVILPTGSTSGKVPLGRGTVDYKLSVSFAREAPDSFLLMDLWGKLHTEGADGKTKGNILGFDFNGGFMPYSDSAREMTVLLMAGTHVRQFGRDSLTEGLRDPNSGGLELDAGPIFVLNHRNLSFRAEVLFPVVQNLNGTQFARGPTLQAGVGIVFPSIFR